MAADNFAEALRRVLVHEGGYSNGAGDPGGPTLYGITHIDYDAYRRRKGQCLRRTFAACLWPSVTIFSRP